MKRYGKIFFLLVMRTLRIDSLNFHVKHTAVLTVVSMLCIMSLVLIYLITGSLYILTTFIQFPHYSPPPHHNHKSDLFLWFAVF